MKRKKHENMILNLSQIKTEALLLFCKDLIHSYQKNEEQLFAVDLKIDEFMTTVSDDILKNLEATTFPNEHYIKNRNHYRISAVLKAYNFINAEISKELSSGSEFNPSMLYFALLATWFKELGHEAKSKEYIYFLIYPYSNVYDKLLVNIKDEKFKALNIKMIEIAERVVIRLEKLSLK